MLHLTWVWEVHHLWALVLHKETHLPEDAQDLQDLLDHQDSHHLRADKRRNHRSLNMRLLQLLLQWLHQQVPKALSQ